MGSAELNNFKWILSAKCAELEQNLHRRDAIAIERSADAVDEIRDALDRDITLQNLDHGSLLLRDVQAALQRVKDGSFGVCINCGEEISPRRLAAVPWTPFCIHCQQDAEHRFVANQHEAMQMKAA